MFSRVLSLALCLVCAPAFSIEITTDTLITEAPLTGGVELHVRGNSNLTINAPGDGAALAFADVHLYDAASLDFQSGKIFGQLFLHGDSEINLSGGYLKKDTIDVGGGRTMLNISDGNIAGWFKFQRGGVQEITIIGFEFGIPVFVGSPGTRLTFTVESDPWYQVIGDGARLVGRGNSIETRNGIAWTLDTRNRLPADTNDDGRVDVQDLNNVRNNFGQPWVAGDTLPFNGRVDIADLNLARNTFGQSFTQPVPEPSSWLLLMAGLPLLQKLRRSFRPRQS